MDHVIVQVAVGVGNMGTLTPVCSCGWRGRGIEGYNDDQIFQVNRQEQKHLREMSKQDLPATNN